MPNLKWFFHKNFAEPFNLQKVFNLTSGVTFLGCLSCLRMPLILLAKTIIAKVIKFISTLMARIST